MNTPATQSQPLDPFTARVCEALAALKATMPDYYARTLAQRAGRLPDGTPNPAAAGSIYPEHDAESLARTLEHETRWTLYAHPDVAPGCVAFVGTLPGVFGLCHLPTLAERSPEMRVRLRDPKQTGKVEAEVEGVRTTPVGYTVAILGQHEGREVVFTFHPGPPVRPSQLDAAGRDGQLITIAEALALGFTVAKIA